MKPSRGAVYGDLSERERDAAWAAVGDDNPFGSPPGFTAWYEAQHPDWRPAYRPTPKRRRVAPPGAPGASVNLADAFCELLRARVTLAQHTPSPLSDVGPAYRCDHLFLVAADFSDSLTLRAQRIVGDDVLREYALEVTAAAWAVYRASVEGAEDGR